MQPHHLECYNITCLIIVIILTTEYRSCIILISVRLVDGSSYNEGRVEVYYSGRWGTVCNDGWTDKYASLVCTQLGFGSSGELADFGAGTNNILLDNVICSVNDTVLASCGHYGVGVTVGCDHFQDVGIKCVYLILYIIIYNLICYIKQFRSSNNTPGSYANC